MINRCDRIVFAHLLTALALTLLCIARPAAAQDAPQPDRDEPKLVLYIIVDQLRGDMPLRMRNRFGEDGFRYLMEQGAWFTDAHYAHNNTVTAVGHASLVTGGRPVDHGIVGNEWADRTTGEYIYCCEDTDYSILNEENSSHAGTSPSNLRSSTIGDELVLASGGASRVFSVSVKDRGAILPAGRHGTAYWYENSTGRFVTSDFYRDSYPEWVTSWNEADHALKYRGAVWELLSDRSTYIARDQDDRPYENSIGSLGRTFPHPVEGESDRRIAQMIRYTPFGDEVTVDFAIALLKEEQLGVRSATDMLCVSFSATDGIGHAFGPNSLEAEDNLLHLDRTIARLLNAVDEQVGLDRVLVALSADHGVAAVPEYQFSRHSAGSSASEKEASGGETIGRLDPRRIVQAINDHCADAFGLNRRFVRRFLSPSIYLDHDAMAELGLEPADVERVAAEGLRSLSGVQAVYTRSDLLSGALPDHPVSRLVSAGYDPERCGDLILILEPGWTVSTPGGTAATHGSPYTYDTHVPVAFAGWGVTPGMHARRVEPASIAPTLAQMLRIPAPSASVTPPLVEVLRD